MAIGSERIEITGRDLEPHERIVNGHLLVIDPAVARDPDRFKQFAPEPRAALPPGTAEEVQYVPTRVLIDERIRRLTAEAEDRNEG